MFLLPEAETGDFESDFVPGSDEPVGQGSALPAETPSYCGLGCQPANTDKTGGFLNERGAGTRVSA